jgi:uncharacterized protein
MTQSQETLFQDPGRAVRARDLALARLLRLPRMRTGVRVQRDIPVPARDGISLITDHYAPSAGPGRGTILVRTPYGRGFFVNF